MKRTIRLCLALLLLGSCWVNASTLTFSVSGLQGEAEKNVLVWLGPEPESAQDRRSFVVSVRDRVERSLQALGYYRPAIDIDIIRTEPTWRVDIAVEPGEPVRIRKIDLQILGAATSDDAFTQLLANTSFPKVTCYITADSSASGTAFCLWANSAATSMQGSQEAVSRWTPVQAPRIYSYISIVAVAIGSET
jgi:outer membrane translocation and assembly module TamA